MLTRTEIKSLALVILDDQGTAAPAEFYDETSYNLRLGAEYMLITEPGEVKDCSSGVRQLRLPPYGCALVSTRELVKLPNNIYGRWGLKIRPALSGLVFQAGPQIEPGSNTRLFGLLFNLSNSDRTIAFEQPMWSIDFERTSPSQAPNPTGPAQKDLGQYTNSLWGVPTGSLRDLYVDNQRLQKANNTRRDAFFAVLLVAVVFLASIVVPIASTLNRDADLQRQIDKLCSEVKIQRPDVDC